MKIVQMYLIDGVAVPKKVWERRQTFGEHVGARFNVLDIALKGDRVTAPRRRETA